MPFPVSPLKPTQAKQNKEANMKHTSFEISYGDHNHEEVIIHRKKRHGYLKLKIASLMLAFLFWLAVTAVGSNQSSSNDQNNQTLKQPAQEQVET